MRLWDFFFSRASNVISILGKHRQLAVFLLSVPITAVNLFPTYHRKTKRSVLISKVCFEPLESGLVGWGYRSWFVCALYWLISKVSLVGMTSSRNTVQHFDETSNNEHTYARQYGWALADLRDVFHKNWYLLASSCFSWAFTASSPTTMNPVTAQRSILSLSLTRDLWAGVRLFTMVFCK